MSVHLYIKLLISPSFHVLYRTITILNCNSAGNIGEFQYHSHVFFLLSALYMYRYALPCAQISPRKSSRNCSTQVT